MLPNNIKSVKILNFALIGAITLSGCSNSYSTSELTVTERCYDGVVYIKEKTGQSNLTVKFNSDSTVSTNLSNGLSCLKN